MHDLEFQTTPLALILRLRLAQALLIGFEEVLPLWMLSTPDVGGLGWNTMQIGKVRMPVKPGRTFLLGAVVCRRSSKYC